MSGNKTKLYYLAGRGRSELVRLVFAASNVDFEDIRYTREEWPAHVKESPSGSLPYVVSPNASEKCILVQSIAIARYYAKKAGMMGANDWEYYLIERAMGQIEDIVLEMYKVVLTPEDKKAEVTKAFETEKGHRLVTHLVKLLKEGGSGFYVGKSLTLADLASVCMTDFLALLPDFVAKFPELAEHRKAVLAANAKVADWIKNRPVTPM